VFNDKGAEADCTAQLQRQYACNDWRLYKSGVVLNLLLAWHMCRTCGWRSPLPVLAEAAMFAAGYWLSQQRCGLYLQHRSLILGAILAGHQVLVRGARFSGRVERAPAPECWCMPPPAASASQPCSSLRPWGLKQLQPLVGLTSVHLCALWTCNMFLALVTLPLCLSWRSLVAPPSCSTA